MAKVKTIARRVSVTAEDIATGDQQDCDSCALALALRRKFNVVASVYHTERDEPGVNVEFYGYSPNVFLGNLELGENVLNFVEAFDEDRKGVTPCAFQLNMPAALLRKIERAAKRRSNPEVK